MSCYLLIHGNRHGAWAWERIKPLLELAGHTAHAIDLPGHGLDKTPLKDLTLNDYKEAVIGYVKQNRLPPFVLVVHSAGGAVAAAIAQSLQHNIEKIIFIAALIPRKGESIMDYIPKERQSSYFEIANSREDRSVPISFEQAQARYFEELSLTEARAFFERLTPEPLAAMLSVVEDDALERLAVQKICIVCSKDQSLPPDTVRNCAKAVGAAIVELECGHNAMLSHPELVVEILTNLHCR